MRLLVGLGNPGEKYQNNRHNVGRLFVEQAKSKIKNQKSKIIFMGTDTFMNNSGSFVKKMLTSNQSLATSDLYIVHDDLDIPLGSYKIQFGKGPELHYGIQSIEGELGTKDFWRVRVGVDNRDQNSREAGEAYVLQDFTAKEKEILDQVFPKIYEELKRGL